ncbi:MAG: hypothetical protein M1365_14655, partial [Actinobacteria bacterium]|nr:hypothetical protein [Actinomycetota bacterium]
MQLGQGGIPVYHYSHGDGQGSIMGLTDAAGTITDQYQYDAWGNPVTLLNPPPNNTYNPYRYTGQQSDSSTNLYYLRNRYYNAQVGRFITQDPIGFKGGLNLFTYVKNNPVNFWDPFGLYDVRWKDDNGHWMQGNTTGDRPVDQQAREQAGRFEGQYGINRAAPGNEVLITPGDNDVLVVKGEQKATWIHST